MCKNTPYFAAFNIELPLLLIITSGMLIRPDHQERWENSEHYHTRCMCILEVAMYGLSVQVCPNCLNHWLLCYLFISFWFRASSFLWASALVTKTCNVQLCSYELVNTENHSSAWFSHTITWCLETWLTLLCSVLWFNMSLNLKIFSDQLLSVNDLSIVINPCTITVVTRQQGGAAREFVKIILHQQMLRISNI